MALFSSDDDPDDYIRSDAFGDEVRPPKHAKMKNQLAVLTLFVSAEQSDGGGFEGADVMSAWGDFGAGAAAKTVQKDLDDFEAALYGGFYPHHAPRPCATCRAPLPLTLTRPRR